MAELYVNVNGTWKQASNYYVNVNGTWKEGSELHAKVSSTWKESGGYGGTSGIVTTNIVLDLDASNTNSYSGSGTTWTDLSGNSNNATLTNGPTFDSTHGGSIVFDGTDDRADLTAGSDFAYGTGDFTIEVWFNVTGTSPQIYGERLFTQTVGGQNYFKVGVADGNPLVKQLYFKYGTGGGNRVRSGFEYTVDQWHHYIVTRNGTTVTQYVDGSLEQTTTGVSFDFDNTTYNPTIAAMTNSNNQNLDGKIAQVRVYKGKGFSASEVLQNFNATKTNYTTFITSNLVLHLDAGNSSSYSGSGTTWSDISGSNNDFTLTNSPTFDSDFSGMIVFDGSDDYASSANDVADFQWGTGAYSYGVWVNADTLTSSGANGFLAFYGDNGATTQKSSQIYVISGNLKHIILDGGTSYILNSSQTISTGTWYYIMFVNPNDGSTDGAKLYVNGLSVGSQTLSALDYGSTLRFARTPKTRGTAYLDGSVAQVHIYKGKALSATEVLQNYNATKDTYGYGTVSDPSGIIATGLDILLDAGNSNSYSGSGTTWTNLAPSSSPFSNATLSSATGTNTYSSSNSGYFDQCRAFVPVTGSTYVTDGTTITYPTMTYSVWCYPDNLGGYQTLVDQGDDNWFFGFNGTALITYDPNATTGAGTVANNNWYNLTMTHTQNDVIKFYKNGIKIKETTSTSNRAPTFSNWSLGGGSVTTSNFNEGFQGYIATIAVYNRALSATEVLQNHNALKSRFGL